MSEIQHLSNSSLWSKLYLIHRLGQRLEVGGLLLSVRGDKLIYTLLYDCNVFAAPKLGTSL